jgi:hypothetical protein
MPETCQTHSTTISRIVWADNAILENGTTGRYSNAQATCSMAVLGKHVFHNSLDAGS